MAYLFRTPQQQTEMLQTIGVPSIDELLTQIPAGLQHRGLLKLPPALTEIELEQHVRRLAADSDGASTRTCFLGGGAYDHFIPSVVDEITGRGEFYTAYTPYQAEASQGSLQAFFEYQSLICELTGLDVSNASLYEGGSAISEAVTMAMRSTDRRGNVVLCGGVHPEAVQVVQTHVLHFGTDVRVAPLVNGVTDHAALAKLVDDQTAAIVVQDPNVLGALEDVAAVSALAHQQGALCIVAFDPLSLGVLKRPGERGADIAVAEGQSLGIPLQFGGPYLGVLACKNEFVRKLPGRLIGETVDRNGKRCFVLNLQAREQHIRREKATSNICTNQGLMALRATVYLAQMGPQGLREVAELCCQKAHYAAEKLAAVPGLKRFSTAPFLKEFALTSDKPASHWQTKAEAAGFDIGPCLNRLPAILGMSAVDRDRAFLVAVTECRTKDDIDRLAAALQS